MAVPLAWYRNNDILLTLEGVQSSTMSSTAYLNSSTRIAVTIWRSSASDADPSTSNATYRVINARTMTYSTGTNGNYQAVAQSTETTALSVGLRGLAIYVVNHLGLNAEWRVPFRVDNRRTT